MLVSNRWTLRTHSSSGGTAGMDFDARFRFNANHGTMRAGWKAIELLAVPTTNALNECRIFDKSSS
jgi:hypothetical protein